MQGAALNGLFGHTGGKVRAESPVIVSIERTTHWERFRLDPGPPIA